MRKLHLLIIPITMLLSAAEKINAQSVLSQDPIYQLVFFDDFDSTSIRSYNWNAWWPWGPNIADSNRWYMPYYGGEIDQDYNNPSFTSDPNSNRSYTSGSPNFTSMITRYHSTPINGNIWIYKSPHPPYNDTAYLKSVPFKFSSAMLMGRNSYKYCYVEMSFRTNITSASSYNAYSPNLWMWASDTAASYSEIDISEMSGKDWTTAPCSHYQHTLSDPFWHGDGFTTGTYVPYKRYHSGAFTPNQWNTIGCEWTPEYIDFYYYPLSADTFQRFSVNKYPVDKLTAMPIIIDNYTPAPRDTFIINFDPTHTSMPFSYDIDYVKVWQVKQNCNVSKTYLNTSSSTYADTLWQNLTIGGSGGSAVFNSGNHHLAGNDYVILQEGFEVSGSTTIILINTMKCQSGQTKNYTIPITPPSPPSVQLNTQLRNKLNDN